MADEAADDGEACRLGHLLDRVRDVPEAVARPRLLDAGGERRLADLEQPLRLGRDLPDGNV